MTFKNSLVRGGLLAAAVFMQGCPACVPDEDFKNLVPNISVDVCATDGIKDCSLEFGTLANGRTQLRKLLITNTGEFDLVIKGVRLSDTTDPAFSIVGDLPTTIAPGEENGQVVEVEFTPQTATVLAGTLIIDSDGQNVADAEMAAVEVTLAGVGQDLGQPELTVSPERCDFGEVAVGVAAFCDVSLGNAGQVELSITEVGYTMDNDPVFQVAGAFPIPLGLPPGSATTVRVQFRPALAQMYSGGLFFRTTDPAHADVTIPLTGAGGAAPTAVARVKTINGQPTSEASPTVRPLDNVIVTGVDSVAGTVDRTIVGYQWELVEKPSTSTVELVSPQAMETGFQFNSSGQNRPGLDVAGTFVVRLTVTDDNGASSSNDARVTLNSVPTEDFHVQITWDSARADIDLHVVRGLGPRWGTNDCHYANCKGSNGLNWGGGNANPHLDVDDTDGFGPENVNIEQPNDGTYTVGVHFYGAGGGPSSVEVTAKVFVQGALLGEYVRVLTACDQWWDVAKVIWGSTATIQELNTINNETRGACF